jgi:protein-L-isoaspartate(D-aspartate) O-methyltransferase
MPPTADSRDDPWAKPRAAMVAEVEADMRQTAERLGRARLSAAVRAALLRVPRHRFVPPEAVDGAYVNAPLQIGHGQTISQPYIVAIMTELLDPRPEASVLEVGTGCGYQTAVLAELFAEVWSVEIIPELAADAGERLRQLGYENVHLRTGDGYAGWPEAGPFDAIIVTAAARRLPDPLVDQLAPGGRMVIPVGGQFLGQTLYLYEKDAAGTLSQRELLPVAFVPLTRNH